MKIALVSPYDFAYPGGVLNHIVHLERQFTRMGHDVKIIAPASRAVSGLGDKFIPIGKPRPLPVSGSIARITVSPWLSSQIKPVLEREKFDIIHLHEPLMPMLCTTILRLADTPIIGTFHASGARSWYNYGSPFTKHFLHKWYSRLSGRIAVSDFARECIDRYFPNHYEIIPNGVDLETFNPGIPPIEKYCDDKLNVLFVGRLEKRKGVYYLIKAFAQVKKEVPESRLIIVGPGTRLRRKYEKMVKSHHLQDVVFEGFVSNDDLPRYYKTAHVFCAPATGWESFGIILLEAMAVGIPLVASAVEGYARLVEDGTDGILVPPRNDKALAQALIRVLKDKALREKLARNGPLKAQQYSWDRIAGRIIDYYNRILHKDQSDREASCTGSGAFPA